MSSRKLIVEPPLPEIYAQVQQLREHDRVKGRTKKPYAAWKLNKFSDAVFAFVVPQDYPWEWGHREAWEKRYLQPAHYPKDLHTISTQIAHVVERGGYDLELSAFLQNSYSTYKWILELTIPWPDRRSFRIPRDW